MTEVNEVVFFVSQNPGLRAKEIGAAFGISRAKAQEFLGGAKQRGILVTDGDKRSVTWRLAEKSGPSNREVFHRYWTKRNAA
jgi:hypothetical protein